MQVFVWSATRRISAAGKYLYNSSLNVESFPFSDPNLFLTKSNALSPLQKTTDEEFPNLDSQARELPFPNINVLSQSGVRIQQFLTETDFYQFLVIFLGCKDLYNLYTGDNKEISYFPTQKKKFLLEYPTEDITYRRLE